MNARSKAASGCVRWLVAAALFCSAGVAQAQASTAQSYPDRTIKIVVPTAAGGTSDVVGRLVGERLSEAWGRPVVVENRPGATSIIGNNHVAKSAPDGYTLLIGTTTLLQAPLMGANLPYDAQTDLLPVSMVARAQNLFVVPATIPANSVKDFIDYMKANPKRYSYGTYGSGSAPHIFGETFSRINGLDAVHVPYKGGGPLINAVLAGEISSTIVDAGAAYPQLKAGRIKVLAVTGTQRFPSLPDVPTLFELGYRGFEPYGWFGVFVPAHTPAAIVEKLSAEIRRFVQTPETAARLEALGVQRVGNTPQEFAATMKADSLLWARVINDGKIRIE